MEIIAYLALVAAILLAAYADRRWKYHQDVQSSGKIKVDLQSPLVEDMSHADPETRNLHVESRNK
jgi:hypothetical protein